MNKRPKILIMGNRFEEIIEEIRDAAGADVSISYCDDASFKLSSLPDYSDFDLIILSWDMQAALIAWFLRENELFNAKLLLYSSIKLDGALRDSYTTKKIMEYGIFDFYISRVNQDWSTVSLAEAIASLNSDPGTREPITYKNSFGFFKYGWWHHVPFAPNSRAGCHAQDDLRASGKMWWQDPSIAYRAVHFLFQEYFKYLVMKESGEITAAPIWGVPRYSENRTDNCFVIMPFKEPFETIYVDHIRPTLISKGFNAIRGDDFYAPGVVMEDVWNGINNCRFVLAELSTRNPNVMYELGIAHTLGKEVVLICQDSNDVPFDFRHLRYLRYEYTPRGCKQLEAGLARAITEILSTI